MNPISLAGQEQLMQWSAPAKAISALTEYGPSVAQAFFNPTMSVPLASYVVINLLSNNIDLKSYPTAYRIIQTVMSPFSLCKGAIEKRIGRKIDLPLRVVTHTSLSTLVLHILKKIPPTQGSGLSLILCHVCVIEITYMAAKRIYELAKKLLSKPKQTLKEKIQNDPQAQALVKKIFLTEPIGKAEEEFKQFEETQDVRRAFCQNKIRSYQEAQEMKATGKVREEQAPVEFTCKYWMERLNELRESGDFSEGCQHIQEAVKKIQNANSIEDFDEIPEMMYLTPRPGYVRFSAVCSITKRPIRYAFVVSEKLPDNNYKFMEYERSVILGLIQSGQKPQNWPKKLLFLESSDDNTLSKTWQKTIDKTLAFEFIQWKEGVHYNDFK